MAGAGNVDKADEVERKEKKGRYGKLTLIIVIGIIIVLSFSLFNDVKEAMKDETQSFFIVNTISSLDNLREEIKRRMLVLEKTASDSLEFRNLVFVSRELDLVREKLVNTKEFLDN